MPLSDPPTIAEIEDDLTARVTATVTDLHVEAVRSMNPSEYNVKAAKGVALIMYTGSQFERPDRPAQRRDLGFQILIGARSLRPTEGHRGVYGYLEDIRTALTGHRTGAIRWFPQAEGFQTEKGGIFWYYIAFSGYDQWR